MLVHDFFKENDKWYLDYPELGLSKEELEIDEEGRILLESVSQNSSRMTIKYSVFPIKNSNKLIYGRETELGAKYIYEKKGPTDPIPEGSLRFCDNMKRIFGHYPLVLYFVKL